MKATDPPTLNPYGICLGTVCDVGWGSCLSTEMWRNSHIHSPYSLAFFVTVPWPAVTHSRSWRTAQGVAVEAGQCPDHGWGAGMCAILL